MRETISSSGHTGLGTFKACESSVRSYGRRFPVVFDRAQGACLYSRDGGKYLDFLMGCSALNYGHNPAELKEALLDYISRDGITHSLDMYSDAKEGFLQEFSETILKPRGLDYRVQFPGPTGANAVEAALKLARKVTGRHNVIAFTNGFHGVTLGALACTGNEHHRGASGLPLTGVSRLPYDGYLGASIDTADYLDRVLSDPSSGIDAPAAVILETVQGEGGLNVASDEWLRRICDIAHRHGALFIVDDIQAGIGRTGGFFSFERAGMKPDIVTLAKSISGYGLPMALVLIDPRIDEWAPGEHNGTFRGNCPAFVTAQAALRHHWRSPGFESSIQHKSSLLKTELSAIRARIGTRQITLKGRGMMQGLQLPSGRHADAVVRNAFEDGLVIETSGPNDEVVKCLPALTISTQQLDDGLRILGRAVEQAMAEHGRAAA